VVKLTKRIQVDGYSVIQKVLPTELRLVYNKERFAYDHCTETTL